MVRFRARWITVHAYNPSGYTQDRPAYNISQKMKLERHRVIDPGQSNAWPAPVYTTLHSWE